ncbi:MAG: DUF1156 domain-containing protein, partial [bacterium]
MPEPQKSFIETQFPVSRLSKESYKERKANYSQTLTGLGKWWGRKPLILVRAAILGLLMPASDDPQKDRNIFLKILTMDNDGLWRRKSKSIPLKEIYRRCTAREREKWFTKESNENQARFRKGVSREEKAELQKMVFSRLSYDEKLVYCDRPEQIDGPSEAAWEAINAHLGTRATSLVELVQELGKKRFGHIARVGDAFCGGGSVPFEAARIGCEAYGSDLNPVAALLTWAALNIVGGGEKVAEQVRAAQKKVYEAVDRQITEWGIEHNEDGWRADAYLYCLETHCPECGYLAPMLPACVIGEKTHTIAELHKIPAERRFDIRIRTGVSTQELQRAKAFGTVKDNALHCPACHKSTPMAMLRGDRKGDDGSPRRTSIPLRPKSGQNENVQRGAPANLRLWEKSDFAPR